MVVLLLLLGLCHPWYLVSLNYLIKVLIHFLKVLQPKTFFRVKRWNVGHKRFLQIPVAHPLDLLVFVDLPHRLELGHTGLILTLGARVCYLNGV